MRTMGSWSKLEDVVTSKLEALKLVDTRDGFGRLLNQLPVGFIIHDESKIVYANQEALTILNCDVIDQNTTQKLEHFITLTDGNTIEDTITRALRKDSSEIVAVVELITDSADVKPTMRIVISPLLVDDILFAQIILQDITDLIAIQKELEHLAATDPLTGVPNRRKFTADAQAEFSRAVRHNRTFAIAVLDVDHFKNVNDTYGHDTGDLVLQSITNIVADMLRDTDKFTTEASQARMGGEEFALLFLETDETGALIAANRIREKIAETIIKWVDGNVSVTVSLGVCVWSPQYASVEEMIKAADLALYQAKSAGRNRVVLAEVK
jgi:diguanylate cyclase (GGDEF)-like protein